MYDLNIRRAMCQGQDLMVIKITYSLRDKEGSYPNCPYSFKKYIKKQGSPTRARLL